MLDRSDADQATVRLLVGAASDGTPFFEEVPVERLGGERYRILASPGLLDGLAAGDVFERSDDGTYRLIERSGNLCVQLLYDDTAPHERFDLEVLPRVHELGGWLDGRTERASVLTFPLTAGFAPIEGLMNAWVASTPGGSWSYGNVYGEDGRTPLGWWARQPAE